MLKTAGSVSGGGGGSGTVTQVQGNGTVNGITLTGSVTTSGNLTLGGTLANVTNSQLSNSSATLGNTTITLGGTTSTVGNLTLQNTTISSVSTPITVSQGGTGLNTLTANNILIGNATGNVTFVAPGTTGNVLTSNGTVWVSQAAGSTGFPITLGNASIAALSTTTSVGNLTLTNVTVSSGNATFTNANSTNSTITNFSSSNVSITGGTINTVAHTGGSFANANITSVAVTFPNSYLANSTTTLGNATLTLGSTTSSVGNLTLTSPTLTTPALGTPASGNLTNCTSIPAAQLTGTVAVARLPAGTVLQVASAYKTDTQTVSSGVSSFVDITGLSVTITPTSSTSKFLCIWSVTIGNGADASHGYVRLVRNGTAIALADTASNRTTASSAVINTAIAGQTIPSTNSYLDSPATASAITYKLTAANNLTGTSNTFINRSNRDNDGTNYDGRSTSSLTVLEVAA